jgi:hypothetical protein
LRWGIGGLRWGIRRHRRANRDGCAVGRIGRRRRHGWLWTSCTGEGKWEGDAGGDGRCSAGKHTAIRRRQCSRVLRVVPAHVLLVLASAVVLLATALAVEVQVHIAICQREREGAPDRHTIRHTRRSEPSANTISTDAQLCRGFYVQSQRYFGMVETLYLRARGCRWPRSCARMRSDGCGGSDVEGSLRSSAAGLVWTGVVCAGGKERRVSIQCDEQAHVRCTLRLLQPLCPLWSPTLARSLACDRSCVRPCVDRRAATLRGRRARRQVPSARRGTAGGRS